MQSLLKTSTNVLWRPRPACSAHRLARALNTAATARSNTHEDALRTFEQVGMRPAIASAVRAAFPNVKHPTHIQSQLIPAIMSNQDVFLKDSTGSGKSFGITMALLNKPRLRWKDPDTGQVLQKQSITTLFIVPHRDLAFQLFHWIERMFEATNPQKGASVSSIAQVIVRGENTDLSQSIELLREQPPHILIGTPQAIKEVYDEDPSALQLSTLSTVVVDEVDYLINSVYYKQKEGKKEWEEARKKAARHPGPTKELLDIIYQPRIAINESSQDASGASRVHNKTKQADAHTPQLIMSSATFRNHLRLYLYTESGWLKRDGLQKIRGSGASSLPVIGDTSEQAAVLGGTALSHHLLVISKDGTLKNIEGAIAADESAIEPVETPARLDEDTEELDLLSNVDHRTLKKYSATPSPFNPSALEAVATAFALDVPSIALLVLPASSSVHRAVFELRELGINAHSLDLLSDDKGRAFLHRGNARIVQGNPTLLVSTPASIRGIDLPDMSHVFILGVPERLKNAKFDGRMVDAYLHIAGRVGRFGRGGKVVTIIEDSSDDEGDSERFSERRGDMYRMKRILGEIKTQPQQYPLFD